MPHSNGDSDSNARRLLWAMILTGGFMVVEIAGGILSGSLALLADAGHMFTDVAALILAWFAFYIARKPPDSKRSYGYHRFQVLAAFINGITLVVLVGWINIEAIRRFTAPVEIMGRTMLIVAVVGLVVNIVSFSLLHGGDRKNLNMQGAAIHVLGDMLGSVATIIAAVVILFTGWTPIDPILSIFVALLILKSAWSLVKKSSHLLLEGAPEWLNVDQLRSELKETIPDIEDIHHVHAWSLSPEQTILTLHACVNDDADNRQTLKSIKKILLDRFGISHSTVQIEQASCSDEAHM